MSNYLDFLDQIATTDVKVLREKEQSYGNSWKARGGQGAFFVAIRKADRLENVMPKFGYDIFKAAESDTREEGILDDIRDLRRYMMLIEAEIIARGNIPPEITNKTVATPAGLRKVPRHVPYGPVHDPQESFTLSTEMESPFGYEPELDDK